MKQARWARITGNGLVYSGPCLLTHILMEPNAANDYADIYDGRDTTSGKKFCRVSSSVVITRHISLGQGVPFDVGIFIHGFDAAVKTTVVFIPQKISPSKG